MILYDQSATASSNPQGLLQQAWVNYKGNTQWPAWGSAKALQMIMLANNLKNDWALDSHVHWDSLFANNLNVGTVVATQQAYALPSTVFYLSDFVYILRSDGVTLDRFKVVHPEARNDANNAVGMISNDYGDPVVYLTGSFQLADSNLTINFVTPFQQGGTNSADVGGVIQAGCYVLPDDMVNATDTVPVNNPVWLVYALAAEMARNDPAKEDQYPNLIAKANDLYQKMVLDNQGNSFQQPNGPEYALQNPGVTWSQY